MRVDANPAFCHLGARAITLPEATVYFYFTQEDGQPISLINPALVDFSVQVLKGYLEKSALIIPRSATVRVGDMVNYFNSDGSCSYGKVIKIVGSNMIVQNSVADLRT